VRNARRGAPRRAGVILWLGALAGTALPAGTAAGAAEHVEGAAAESADATTWTFRWEGSLRAETAVRLDGPRTLAKQRNLVRMRGVATSGRSGLAATVGVRGFYDAAYDLTDRYAEEVEESLGSEGVLREAFLEWSGEDFALRVGKQQVVWGEAFGRFLTDIVVPKDLREFLLPEFEFIRIPLWMADLNWMRGDLAVETVLVPDLKYSFLPPAGAEFAPAQDPAIAGTMLDPARRPPRTLANAEYGARVSWIRSGWDVSALFFRGFDDLPVPFRRTETDPVSGGPVTVVSPGPDRMTTLGGTVSKSRGRAIGRLEVAYDRGRLYPAADPADADGVVEADRLGMIAGLDLALPRRSMLGIQVLHQEAVGSSRSVREPPGPSALMLRAMTWEAAGRWSGQIEVHLGLDGDSMIRPRAGYRFGNSLEVAAGFDLFAGPGDTFYGQFSGSDRFFVDVSYAFPPSSPGATRRGLLGGPPIAGMEAR
jgi:hypothetical protein